MNPALFRTGPFLAAQLAHEAIDGQTRVLDMGAGSGILTVFAAARSGRVTAVDINARAVRCTRINALLNRVEERVDVVQGDLFAPLAGRRFDLVLFNPPFYAGKPRDSFDTSWRAENMALRFAAGLRDHLPADGSALIVLSTQADQVAFLDALQAHDLSAAVVARQDLRNEILTVFRLQPPSADRPPDHL